MVPRFTPHGRTKGAVVGHPGEPVLVVGPGAGIDVDAVSDIHPEWGDAGDGHCGRHPIGECGGTRKGMWSATRRAHHRALRDAEGLEELLHIGGAVCDLATDLRGTAVPGATGRHQADAARSGGGETWCE
jgi:hypothetical protein